MNRFKVGDEVKIVRCNCVSVDLGGCRYESHKTQIGKTGKITDVDSGNEKHPYRIEGANESWGDDELIHYYSQIKLETTPYFNGWQLTTNGLSDYTMSQINLNPRKNIMSNVVTKIKELSLSSDEKLLRKHGLRDRNGWTCEATEVLDAMMLEERRADLVAKVKELDAEEKKEKKNV